MPYHNFSSEKNLDLQFQQSDWLREFWFEFQEPDFSQIWDLCKNIARTLIIEQIQEKLMTAFVNKFKF